jgi:hypothetical protein
MRSASNADLKSRPVMRAPDVVAGNVTKAFKCASQS